MVGTNPIPDRATVEAIRARLDGTSHRFFTATHRGLAVHPAVDFDDLAELVAEIVAEYTDHLVAERDALAEDLAWELNATRTVPGAVA